ASDQYALGVIVYEWLCGERPFNGTATEIAMQHISTPPPPLHEKIPTIPPEVEQVVMQALAKDPKQRFANVQAFAEALERACQTKPAKGTTLLTYRGHTNGVREAAWLPVGRWLASGTHEEVQVWEASMG